MNYIFTVSNTTKQDIIINRFHVEKEKIIITHNATNEEFRVLENKPQIAFEKFGVNGPFIFHLSKFSVRKNPWTIIKAFKILKSENKNIKLVLGGKGWKNRDVIDYARKNGLDKDIVFTGFISQSEMIELLNLAKIFVFPSLFEGFGIPNIEAMACGCPVITSNSFAIPEIVGDAAIILKDKRDPVELAKKMKMILEDDNLRKSLINKGLKQAKLYSWNKSANIVLNTYKKCLNMD